MLPIMTDVSHLLAMLRQQAADLGESRCHLLPDRVITYRRLWSRIERASARLQGEWGVQRGQTVAYVGCGHPDAIVLYGALLRIGAVFLPLESLPESSIKALLADSSAALAIMDDGMSLQDVPTRPLSLLLADWCPTDPAVVEEDPSVRALLLPTSSGSLVPTSLLELCVALPGRAVSTTVTGPIFTPECLTHIVLPALRDGQILHFAAVEERRTGT